MVSVSQNFECDSVNDRGLPMSLSIKSLSLSSVVIIHLTRNWWLLNNPHRNAITSRSHHCGSNSRIKSCSKTHSPSKLFNDSPKSVFYCKSFARHTENQRVKIGDGGETVDDGRLEVIAFGQC